MGKLSSRNLKWVRNAIIAAEMIVLFILWSYIPAIIKNNSLVHVGNGKYGPGAGFLLLVPFPLLGLIARGGRNWDDAEIHTDDSVERARIEEIRKTKTTGNQILLSIALFLGALLGILAAVFLG